MKKHKIGWQTTKKERLSYYLFFSGQLIFNTIVMSFVLVLLLNIGMNEILAGTIILAPKIWDAVNDTLFGFVVDRIHLKGGRFLPWIKLSAIIMPIATIFLFSVPDSMGVTGKCVWVIVGYILWDTGYTISDTPIYALSTSMTNNMDERTTILYSFISWNYRSHRRFACIHNYSFIIWKQRRKPWVARYCNSYQCDWLCMHAAGWILCKRTIS